MLYDGGFAAAGCRPPWLRARPLEFPERDVLCYALQILLYQMYQVLFSQVKLRVRLSSKCACSCMVVSEKKPRPGQFMDELLGVSPERDVLCYALLILLLYQVYMVLFSQK